MKNFNIDRLTANEKTAPQRLFQMFFRILMSKISAVNHKNSLLAKTSYLSGQMLSLERRLLYRQVKASNGQQKKFYADDELWCRISKLHENYLHRAWAISGRKLNLKSPSTLGEKIEWLKLNYQRELLIKITDKLASREFVVEATGVPSVLNRIYGVYDCTGEIPFHELPERFVIKTNRWSGDVWVNRGGQSADIFQLEKFDKLLQRKYGDKVAEWPYWHIEPKVFVEEYLENQFAQLVDYKFFCFNGVPKLVRVGKDRYHGEQQISYFDTNWNLMPFRDAKAPNLEEGNEFPCPSSYDDMLRYAVLLSKSLPFVRVDFYDIFGECRFGELTLYHESGCGCNFHPENWNHTIGEWLELPNSIRNPKMAYGVNL